MNSGVTIDSHCFTQILVAEMIVDCLQINATSYRHRCPAQIHQRAQIKSNYFRIMTIFARIYWSIDDRICFVPFWFEYHFLFAIQL